MMQKEPVISDVLSAVEELKGLIELNHFQVTRDWVCRDAVKLFFGYKDTQLAMLERKEKLIISKVGKRKFYKRSSITQL